ncbi:hypothetical protein NE237_013344 [Protea cynaroides]|uniref:Pectinesterase n=1 Tax=Protea cynaroides TaxID=273540 RepID=A0A9Q0H0T5_9MAGN|nr:hypothetical protein NE237_013344 [Protea cynaroides]
MAGGYGQVSIGRGGGRSKKRIMVISISSLVLVAMVVAVAVTVHHSAGNNEVDTTQIESRSRAIKDVCEPTDYKKTCMESLSSANTTDLKELVQVAFRVAMNHISEAVNKSETLRELEKDKMASQALDNCKELMDSAIADLQRSWNELGALDLSKMDDLMADIKIWLSATLAYEETCLDGFKNTSGNAGESMRKALKTAGEITRNGLAIVNKLSSVLTSFDLGALNRRLLSTSDEPDYPMLTEDGFPIWTSATKRRLLAVPKQQLKPDVVVAKDGSGKYNTISQALNDIPKKKNTTTFVIYIKAGIYQEYVEMTRSMTNVMLIGDGPLKTKITGKKNFIDGTATFKTATFGALLLQGSSQMYSWKVEYLYSLVLQALEFISQKRKQDQPENNSVQPDGVDSHIVPDEKNELFLGLDDVQVEAKNCLDGGLRDEYNDALHHFVKLPTNLVVFEGDCLDAAGDGELESYLEFLLLDPCDAVAINNFSKGDQAGAHQNVTHRGSLFELRQSRVLRGQGTTKAFGSQNDEDEDDDRDRAAFEETDVNMPETASMDTEMPLRDEEQGDAAACFDSNEILGVKDPNCLEGLCWARLNGLLASILGTEKQSELATREQDSHAPFDIHKYGRRVLEKLSLEADGKGGMSFTLLEAKKSMTLVGLSLRFYYW